MDQSLIALGVPAAMVIGFFLKKNERIANGSIPLLNFGLAFLGQLLLEVSPANAGILDGAFAKTIGQMLVSSGLLVVLSSGTHSTLKNSWQLLRDSLLAQAKERAAQEVMKQAQPKP